MHKKSFWALDRRPAESLINKYFINNSYEYSVLRNTTRDYKTQYLYMCLWKIQPILATCCTNTGTKIALTLTRLTFIFWFVLRINFNILIARTFSLFSPRSFYLSYLDSQKVRILVQSTKIRSFYGQVSLPSPGTSKTKNTEKTNQMPVE